MIKNNRIKLFIFYYLPVILWMGVIFYFSSIKGDGMEWKPNLWFYVERKGAHITEYMILTFLIVRALIKGITDKKELLKRIILAGELSLVYALSDEIHQKFVFGREGKLFDIGMDLIGILIAIFLVFKFYKTNLVRRILG